MKVNNLIRYVIAAITTCGGLRILSRIWSLPGCYRYSADRLCSYFGGLKSGDFVWGQIWRQS